MHLHTLSWHQEKRTPTIFPCSTQLGVAASECISHTNASWAQYAVTLCIPIQVTAVNQTKLNGAHYFTKQIFMTIHLLSSIHRINLISIAKKKIEQITDNNSGYPSANMHRTRERQSWRETIQKKVITKCSNNRNKKTNAFMERTWNSIVEVMQCACV